ncbi:MAG: helix-turn-helix transcriptional regulator [Saccharospirillaceae bacterium]|nr:hypothetical protein A3759_11035 [Thalassolituus sp. HI0120]MCH2040982.1 helix-turn-helix transcriptional regulator [Saccharospirillaceae bacterium]
MSPTVQVDVVVLQHLLNFWDSRNIDINPIWKVLNIDATQPLPRWVAAERLSGVHKYLVELGFGEILIAQAGQYLAQQNLPLTRLLACGETLEKSLPQCIRFTHLTVGNAQFELELSDDSQIIRVVPAQRSDCSCQLLMALACLSRAIAEVLVGTLKPGELSLHLPWHVADHRRLEELLLVPVIAGEVFALEIQLPAWQRQNPAHNATVFRYTLREVEKDDQKFREYLAIYNELKKTLEQCLLERNVSQEVVAARMDISVRNLQRRLKALGTSYQSLLDEARQELTMKLILDEATPLYEISFMVGYTEPSAFYKAFKRWTGKTPGEYRMTLAPEAAKTEVNAVLDEV